MIAVLLAFLHFVAIFSVAATLVFEWITLTPTPILPSLETYT